MYTEFHSDCIYTAESDVHFPELTIEETLRIAAEALMTTSPRQRLVEDLTNDTLNIFGLASCAKTKLGNEFIRGVSGGERKRVTLAEAFMRGAAVQCWDNSTRGMDSSTALCFIRSLAYHVRRTKSAAAVSIYQCSQAVYDSFDKVTLLYKGRQVYFGPAKDAEAYFTSIGFQRISASTSTADFLTALTHSPEAVLLVRPGWENLVPRTADDFVRKWHSSVERLTLLSEIADYESKHPFDDSSEQRNLLRECKGQIRTDYM